MASPVKAPAPVGLVPGVVPGVVPSPIPVALKSPMSPTAASPVREAKVTECRGHFRDDFCIFFESVFVSFSFIFW